MVSWAGMESVTETQEPTRVVGGAGGAAEKVLVPEQLMEAQAVDTAVTGPAEPDVAVTEAESKVVSTVAGQYVGWLSVSTVAALTTAGTVSAP